MGLQKPIVLLFACNVIGTGRLALLTLGFLQCKMRGLDSVSCILQKPEPHVHLLIFPIHALSHTHITTVIGLTLFLT